MRRLGWLVLLGVMVSTACALPFGVTLPFGKADAQPAAAADVIMATQVCPTCAAVACPDCPTAEPCPATATVPALTDTPTVKPSKTLTPTKTKKPPTATVTFTATNTKRPTRTATATATPAYALQAGNPLYLRNFAHPDQECTWMGVAGQVFDKNNQPMSNVVVVVEGFLGDQAVDQIGLAGLAPAYGPGGYEVLLANQPTASKQTLFISLYDLSGQPLSYLTAFDTYAECEKNLILINFKAQK